MASRNINTFTNENHDEMWCRHARALHCTRGYKSNEPSTTAINRGGAYGFSKCLGKACPALVFTQRKGCNWIGYCGVDHP